MFLETCDAERSLEVVLDLEDGVWGGGERGDVLLARLDEEGSRRLECRR